MFKYDKQLVALLASRGVKVFQVHGDDMAKVPMVIPARPGSSPKGFVMQRDGGRPAFTQLDHSFPVAERMLLSTSGWVFCDVPSVAVELGSEKPQLRTGRPATVHAFVRPVRYAPGSCKTHVKDLMDALEKQGVDGSEVGLIGVNNGADYSVQNATFQHFVFRIFRKKKMVLLIIDAQAPYHSAWHWEVEGQWTVPRRLIAGQAFGKFDHRRLEADGVGREARLIEVCNGAVREYVGLLRAHAQCGGNPWIVEPRKREDGEQFDFDKVHEFYTCPNLDLLDESFDEIRREAVDLQKHCDKRPSSLRFRMCTACEQCRQIIRIKQTETVGWSPEVVLAPLASNDFMPCLVRRGWNVHACLSTIEDDAPRALPLCNQRKRSGAAEFSEPVPLRVVRDVRESGRKVCPQCWVKISDASKAWLAEELAYSQLP